MSAPEPTPHRAGANDTQSPVQSVPASMLSANLLGGESAVSAAAPVLPPVSFPTNDEKQSTFTGFILPPPAASAPKADPKAVDVDFDVSNLPVKVTYMTDGKMVNLNYNPLKKASPKMIVKRLTDADGNFVVSCQGMINLYDDVAGSPNLKKLSAPEKKMKRDELRVVIRQRFDIKIVFGNKCLMSIKVWGV